MHVSTTTRRSGENEYTATLLRRSYRQDGKVKKETLANLSHLPAEAIDAIRRVLAGETLVNAEDAFEIERSLPAGHVNAALVMARRLELAKLLDRSRVPGAGSVHGDDPRAGDLPGIEARDGPHARAVDARQSSWGWRARTRMTCTPRWTGCSSARTGSRIASPPAISRDGEMVLYDVSSSYFEGRTCPLARLGYSRDGKRGLPQIIYGLLCDSDGRPVAVEVFTGELHDDKTLPVADHAS